MGFIFSSRQLEVYKYVFHSDADSLKPHKGPWIFQEIFQSIWLEVLEWWQKAGDETGLCQLRMRTCMWSCEGDEGCWALEARGGVHKSPLLSLPFSPSGTERTSWVRLNAFRSAMFKEILSTYLQAPSQKYKHFSLRALGGQVRHQKTGKKCKHGAFL